jgi:DNA-3-methyladenine glycosylase
VRRGAAPRARRDPLGAPLAQEFYDRDTEQVARDLLGCIVACRSPEGLTSGRIVETEAYLGPHDPACHAVAGLTNRTRWLFGPPGVAYVYFIYGVHWCLNAVTREEGHGSAVLIRAVEPVQGVEIMRERRGVERDRDLTNGPGKLCQAMGITGRHNGLPLATSALTIHPGAPLPDEAVAVTPRIGITKAAEWPLRWVVRESAFLSRRAR